MGARAALLRRLRRRRIAVLMGGWSAEREISLKSGKAVGAALKRLGLPHAALDLTPEVAAHLRRKKIDLAFLTTHGSVGEDGRLQGLLDVMGIPYAGSGVLASALAMHKPTAKIVFTAAGIPTPRWRAFGAEEKKPSYPRAAAALGKTLVVKPADQGSAVGVRIVNGERDWAAAIREAGRQGAELLVEPRVAGTEITVGVLGRRALPAVEIVPRHAFYDFHSKYAPGGSRHLIPPRLPAAVLRRAGELALAAHRALGCRHVSRTDFIVDKRGRPWTLETNTLPGLTDTSLLPDEARAAGISFDDLVLDLLRLALADAGSRG